MSKDIFVEKCMDLFSMSDQEIIKSILKDSLDNIEICLLYTSPSPRDLSTSRMPSSA